MTTPSKRTTLILAEKLLFESLASVGLMWIARYGSILDGPRSFLTRSPFFKDLLSCSLCTGFWSGVIIGLISYFISPDPFYVYLPLVSSALSWFFDSLLDLIQESIIFIKNK